jgi:phage gpG-like protein
MAHAEQTAEEFATEMEGLASDFRRSVPGALRACEQLVEEDVMEHFARQESPDGDPWPARKGEGDGHPLLVETNTQGAGSLLAAATGQGGGHVSRIEDDDTLVYGVDKDGGIGGIPGAGVHNYGFPSRNIAQREFLGLDDQAAEGVGVVIADNLAEALEL